MELVNSCDNMACDDVTAADASCECVWNCGRGRTRLCCQLRCHAEGDFELEVLRNNRLYGTYRFVERVEAIRFASRLRHIFEGNGWIQSG